MSKPSSGRIDTEMIGDVLFSNILDAIEEIEDEEEDESEISIITIEYYKDELTSIQFQRMIKYVQFITSNIKILESYHCIENKENSSTDEVIISLKDEKGLFHTCFIELWFREEENFSITVKMCSCDKIREELTELLLFVLFADSRKLFVLLDIPSYIPEDMSEKWNSALKMYLLNHLVESWQHIGFLAEQMTIIMYKDCFKDSEDIKEKNWKRMLARIEHNAEDPMLEHQAFLLDSLRPIRNLVVHHNFGPTIEDVEFGLSVIHRVLKLYYQNDPTSI